MTVDQAEPDPPPTPPFQGGERVVALSRCRSLRSSMRGEYIRNRVPELAKVFGAAIHDPDESGCRPRDYPAKIVGHREGRERALEAGRHAR